MKKRTKYCGPLMAAVLCALCLVTVSGVAFSQIIPWQAPQHRVEYRDLGYQHFNQIPADGSFITSLALGSDGRVYGATTGHQAYLFVYSDETNQVKPLGHLPGVEGVHHSLAVGGGADGVVYIGGGKNVIKQDPIKYDWGAGLNHVSEDLWIELEERYASYRGGHLYRYDPAAEARVGLADTPLKVRDLGIPVRGDGIYCMTIDPDRNALYGISYPHAHFFVYDLKLGRRIDKGSIFEQVLFGGPSIRTLRSLPRELVVDGQGFVYASSDDGKIIRYDPEKGELETLDIAIPGEYMTVVDAWAKDGNVIYGGTSEGFLFRFNPTRGRIDNLGKPAVYQRIRGLTIGDDGKVYGIAGDRDYENMLFSYDPRAGVFDVIGSINVDRSPYYSWEAHQFDAMITGRDGTIYMGESDRKGHLFLYIP